MNPSLRRLRYISKALRWLPPEMPGKARLARHLLGSCLDAHDVRVNGRGGATFVTPSLREPVGFHLLVNGTYETQVLDFALEQLKPGAIFVDVGANIGAFTIPAARRVGPAGRVIAIEPSLRIFPYLHKNVTLNELSNVHLIQCAAYDRDGQTVSFYEAPVDHFGMGSLAAQFQAEPIPVPTQTLDLILSEQGIEEVDLIKVDVEGFEAAVFRGAEKLLTGINPPPILFEFCDWAEVRVPGGNVGDAQRVLKSYGYDIWILSRFVRASATPLDHFVVEGSEMFVAIKANLKCCPLTDATGAQ